MSKVIRVTKGVNFEMANTLYGYDGACKNMHGHSYQLKVCVKGKIKQDPEASNNGMVIDFSFFFKTHVIDRLDHGLMLNANSPHRTLANGADLTINKV